MDPQIKEAVTKEAQALDEIMTNAQAVHGQDFAQYLSFVQRGATAAQIGALLNQAPKGVSGPLSELLCDILAQQAAAYAEALGLSPAMANEALRMSQMMSDRTRALERQLKGAL